MKKFIKISLLCILVVVCALCGVACNDGNKESKTGLIYKQNSGDNFYTIYGYVDDGKGVTSLDIGKIANDNNVTFGKINANAFQGNSTLKEIYVPDTVTEIGNGAFSSMTALEKIVLPFVGKNANSDGYYGETPDAVDKAVDMERHFAYVFGTETTVSEGLISVAAVYAIASDGTDTSFATAIPRTLKTVEIASKEDYTIPMFAFAGLQTIRTVNLGNKIDGIGDNAFSGCTSLKTVNIPAKATRIGNNAFKNCTNLKDFANGEGFTLAENSLLEKIGEYAFVGTKIKNFKFYGALTEIGKYAFSVNIDTENNAILGSSLIESIDLSACANLEKVSYGAFYYCSQLNSVKLNANTTKIESFAFARCEKLETANFIVVDGDLSTVVKDANWNLNSDKLI